MGANHSFMDKKDSPGPEEKYNGDVVSIFKLQQNRKLI